MNPDEFVISRKRKKYKFAKFFNADNCFEFDNWEKRHVDIVELGAGTGLFSVELAVRHPDKIFVAIDVKADRLQKGAYEALERGVKNLYFIRARADQLSKLIEARSLETIWLTFPDPFPKKGSAGRRMTHPTFLKQYQQLLKNDGTFRLKHDDDSFFMWSLEQLVVGQWHIQELAFDLHESTLDDDFKIMTSYEERWTSQGKPTHFVTAQPAVMSYS